MANNNPWRGLASYKDPLNSKRKYQFSGRDAEASSLVKLIDNNLFVTLYGRTGVGKTSLLNAGVFPVLRQRGYFPIYIRLSQEATGITYAEAIVNKIKSSGLKECCSIDINNNDGHSKTYLWNYFCTTTFQNDEGHKVYPVIVLDQFEEIFFTEKERAELLLQQIYTLLNDDLALPDEDNYSDETNYRFVASIREDNLFYLEDSIDELSLNLYKENRYRLRPLKPENAKTAILEPGFNCIDKENKEEIAEKIISISKDKDGTISSLILSLICSLMYEKATEADSVKPIIQLRHIPDSQKNADRILSDFYLNNTTKKQRTLIEENLLTDEGHRKASDIEIPNCESLLSEGNRILQKVETDAGEMVEIVHDRMARVIYMQRRKRDNNRFRKLLRIVVFVLLLIAFSTAIKMSWTSTTRKVAIAQYTPKYKPAQTTYTLNEDPTTKDTIDNSSNIKSIYIGASVSNIDSLTIKKDSIDVIVSPHNKHIGWGYVHYNGHLIGYLYYKNKPDTALYMQEKFLSGRQSIRLPKGLEKLNYNYYTYKTTKGLPAYGEKNVVIDDTLNACFFAYDKEIETVRFNNIKNIPSSAFEGCSNLTNVDFTGIEEIGIAAFCYSNLKEIDLSSNEEVKVDWFVFKECMNLEKAKLPKRLKGDVAELFAYCQNLRNIELPNEIEDTANVENMFIFCTNIQSIDIHPNSRFRLNPKDSIVYYDSIPVIFSKCHLNEWDIDSTYRYDNGLFHKKERNSYNILSYSPTFVSANWNRYHGTYYSNHKTIIKNTVDSVLYLPALNGSALFTMICIGDFRKTKEIHTNMCEPDLYRITINGSVNFNQKGIILYVPYGCKEAYEKHKSFGKFKEIREDSMACRIISTINYYWDGIVSYFGAYTFFLYSLIIIGLIVLFCWFYLLRMKQLKNLGIQNRKSAIMAGLLGMPVAIISFIPAYYLIYIYMTNYTEIKSVLICVISSSTAGVISSCICSYIFVFSGKGKIWKSIKRMTKTSIK